MLEAENLDDKRWPARVLMGVIQRWKDRALTPDKVSAADAGDLAGGKLVDLYRDYQDRLRTLNAADFGDLLLHNLTIFAEHPEVPVHRIDFGELTSDPAETIRELIEFLGIEPTEEEIESAIAHVDPNLKRHG